MICKHTHTHTRAQQTALSLYRRISLYLSISLFLSFDHFFIQTKTVNWKVLPHTCKMKTCTICTFTEYNFTHCISFYLSLWNVRGWNLWIEIPTNLLVEVFVKMSRLQNAPVISHFGCTAHVGMLFVHAGCLFVNIWSFHIKCPTTTNTMLLLSAVVLSIAFCVRFSGFEFCVSGMDTLTKRPFLPADHLHNILSTAIWSLFMLWLWCDANVWYVPYICIL